MDLKPLQTLICRTPAFSINSTMAEMLPELKTKIQESSPAFSDFIDSLSAAELNQLDEKINYTLWKYANRAKYRSTPFGSFAAVSILPLAIGHDEIIIDGQMQCSHLIDWSQKQELSASQRDFIDADTIVCTNSSIYFVADSIRYLRLRDGNHELAAVKNIPELEVLLNYFKSKKSVKESYALMAEKFNMKPPAIKRLLQQLLNLQLLLSENCSNITGEDYFQRLKIVIPKSPQDYIIAKRKVHAGGFSEQHLKKIPSYISFLAQQFPWEANTDLFNFKTAFINRFEHQEISLAMVMDPEVGIGYGNLAQLHNSNPLINEIKNTNQSNKNEILDYGDFHAFLLNQIISKTPIKIEDFKPVEPSSSIQLPNTLSVLFHIYENQLVIASAGGATANALIGRFTMENEGIEAYANEISNIEANANPEVIFFDIAYQLEQRVDNVNRRKLVYPSELPILCWSTTSNPLDCSDILVSVVNDEVILRSKKLGKRLVPRIASAYNAKGTDLAVYRFLNDVQNQGIITNLGFKLSNFFPKLAFYPRVSFHNLIVSPATWLVPKHLYQNIEGDGITPIANWLTNERIEFRFRSGYADATLCFDPQQEEDLLAFLSFCKQQPDDVYISEALVSDSGCISDEQGGRYFPQYIANFAHQELVYPPSLKPANSAIKIEHLQMPGGEWLYFELYSHTGKSNQLLLTQIHQFIQLWQGQLRKWFFIRFNLPSPHLRLRLHLKHAGDGFKMMEALKLIMEPEMKLGSLIDFKIKTYVRETHRYGPQRMDLIERFFMIDSQYVIQLLRRTNKEDVWIASSLKLLQTWLTAFIPSLTTQINFVEKMASNFAVEMQLVPTHFKKINATFNALRHSTEQLAILPSQKLMHSYEKAVHKILETVANETDLENLLANLIHMHINRLFSVDQRLYETLIYHYLRRILQTKKATTTT